MSRFGGAGEVSGKRWKERRGAGFSMVLDVKRYQKPGGPSWPQVWGQGPEASIQRWQGTGPGPAWSWTCSWPARGRKDVRVCSGK